MLISLIVPIYNVENYIEDCLRSIAGQTYRGEIECILVNDSTLDRSWILVQEFVNKYRGQIKFVLKSHDMNLGLSAARNTGLLHATGDYVLFIDSDDELVPEAIEKLVEPLSRKYYDFVIGAYSTVPVDTKVVLFNEGEIMSTESIKQSYVSDEWYPMAWNKLCNRRFIIEHQLLFLEGLIHEDELWSFQLADKASSMYKVSPVTYKYKIRDNSIMSSSMTKLELKFRRKIILYEKINIYIYNKKFQDILDYHFLDKKLVNLLNDLFYHRNNISVKQFYKDIRNSFTPALKSKCICLSAKHFIRNFHLVLPCSIGCLYWMIYRLVHQSLKTCIRIS